VIKVKMTQEAFNTMTTAQKKSIDVLLNNPKLENVVVQKGGFDLPNNYLCFTMHWTDHGQPIYGGISPQGQVST
jgi:hypothetical protein